MIAFAIILMLTGLVSFNIRSAWREQTFRTEVDAIVNQLRMAQDLLMLLNIETEIHFTPEEIAWIPVGTINRVYEKMIQKEVIHPSELASVKFETNLEDKVGADKEADSFSLNFHDRGFQMSRGVLTVSSKGGEEVNIYLRGYPAPIEVQSSPVDLVEKTREDQVFIEKLTQTTWSDPNVQKK